MNTMSEIEQVVKYLSRDQQGVLLEWLASELDSEKSVAEPRPGQTYLQRTPTVRSSALIGIV